jgi:hypothetical protein
MATIPTAPPPPVAGFAATATVAKKTFLDEDSFEDAVRHLVNDYQNRNVYILKKIFQGTNAKYTEAHREFGVAFKFDRDGVCDAMSMEFIRLGRRGGDGAAGFRYLIDGNWAYLGMLQSEFTAMKRSTAKPLLDLNDELGRATRKHDVAIRRYERASGFEKLLGSVGIGSVPSSSQYALSKQALARKNAIIDSEADNTSKALDDLQANTVYCSKDPAVLARRESVFKDVALSNLVPELMSAFDKPAYYYLVLSDLGKHAMAFEITADGKNHRFMDPNGYELQIGTRGFLRPFLIDYFSIYSSPKWGSLQHSQCSLVRFN